MTSSIKLALPALSLLDSYVEALREGHYLGMQPKADEQAIAAIVQDPDGFIQSRQPDLNPQGVVETPDGSLFEKVPHLWLWLSVDGAFIGDVSLRLKLSPVLEHFGGHVGYGIRPSRQGQGWATKMLGLTVDYAWQHHHIKPLLLTCSDDNPASQNVIERNGGIFLRETDKPYGFGPGRVRLYEIWKDR